MEFGSVLRRMRKGADMSQEEISMELHISRSTISKLETNQMELKAVDLINWCNITNSQEILAAFIIGMDSINILQSAAQLITGSILFLGGIL